MQVVITITRSADDLLTEFSSGAKLYLYSASSSGGSYSAVGTGTAIVSGQQRYEVYDSAGTPGTTWYKFRAGNSGGTLFTDYSDPWLSTSLTAYATLDDLKAQLAEAIDTRHDGMLETWLADVSDFISTRCGRRFYRSPQVTGTTTVYFDVLDYSDTLSFATMGRGTTDGQALDIVSITNLYVRASELDAYVEVTAGDTGYYLQPGAVQGLAGTDVPYEDVVLSPSSSLYTCFPRGYRAVKVVGVMGWPRVPGPVRQATIADVRERFRQSVSGGAAPQGINQFGVPVFQTGDSAEVQSLIRSPYAKRSWVA